MLYAMKPLLMKRGELAKEASNLRRRRRETELTWNESERLKSLEQEMARRGMGRRKR